SHLPANRGLYCAGRVNRCRASARKLVRFVASFRHLDDISFVAFNEKPITSLQIIWKIANGSNRIGRIKDQQSSIIGIVQRTGLLVVELNSYDGVVELIGRDIRQYKITVARINKNKVRIYSGCF